MNFSLNFILLIIIFVFLLYSFIKTRKEEKQRLAAQPIKPVLEKPVADYEKIVVAAVIAAVMDKKKYVVKSVYLGGQVDEKKSSWKLSGRLERMNSRIF